MITLVSLVTGKDNLGLIAGDGWVADALWRFEPAPGSVAKPGDGVTIWATSWKTDEDAADFAYGMERCLQSRFAGQTLVADPLRGGRVLSRPDRVYRIDQTGLKVVVQVLTPAIDSKIGPDVKKKGPSPPPKPVKK